MADNAEEAKNEQKSKGRPRIHLLDELRGIAVFCMIFYHAFYAMGMIFQFQLGADLIQFFSPAEPFFAGLFILISGIACNLTHSNLERGCKLFFLAYAVTLVTFFAVGPDEVIQFGILHMLSISMIAYGLLTKINAKIPMWLGMTIHIILFVVTFTIAGGYIGIPFLLRYDLPSEWYSTGYFYYLGLPGRDFISSDYFPLMPWLFLFFAGGFFGKLIPAKKFPKFAFKKHLSFFAFFGRHSLIIYLIHQPVIFAILGLVQLIPGVK